MNTLLLALALVPPDPNSFTAFMHTLATIVLALIVAIAVCIVVYLAIIFLGGIFG